VVDFMRYWSDRTEMPTGRFIRRLGIASSKFYDWKRRYGKVNEHNGWIPRDFWLEPWEKKAIIAFYLCHPKEGYRRLSFMMLDADLVAVSPSSTYRVLRAAGLLQRWKGKASQKGTGFQQPTRPPEHWHVDVCYINICGQFTRRMILLQQIQRTNVPEHRLALIVVLECGHRVPLPWCSHHAMPVARMQCFAIVAQTPAA
jgi:hypothetical protein